MNDIKDPIGYHTLGLLSGADNYNRWMFKTLAPFCSGNILEIGSGVGNISECLLENFENVTLSDLRSEYCEVLHKRFDKSDSLEGIHKIDLVETEFEKSYNHLFNKFDTIIALNVIEHIKDDSLAINNCKKLLKEDGKLIVLVPAYQCLYNQMDSMLEHYRRYSQKKLKSLLKNEGMINIHSQYFNAAGILGWWLTGSFFNHKTIPEKNINLFNKLVFLFKIIDIILFYKIGLSVLVVAKNKV